MLCTQSKIWSSDMLTRAFLTMTDARKRLLLLTALSFATLC